MVFDRAARGLDHVLWCWLGCFQIYKRVSALHQTNEKNTEASIVWFDLLNRCFFIHTHRISPKIRTKTSKNLSSSPSGPFLHSEGPKIMPKSSKIEPKRPKDSQSEPKVLPRGTQWDPKGPQRDPMDPQMYPKCAPSAPRGNPRNYKSKNIKNTWGNTFPRVNMSINTWEKLDPETYLLAILGKMSINTRENTSPESSL